MTRFYNIFFKFELPLLAALLAACVTSLGAHGNIPENQRAFLEIESGLSVTAFDSDEVNWGIESFFGSAAEIAIPAGLHTLLFSARKEISEEAGTRSLSPRPERPGAPARIITTVYTHTATAEIEFLPNHRYKVTEDSSFMDFFLGAAGLKLNIEDISE
jgi:hypothetical protein